VSGGGAHPPELVAALSRAVAGPSRSMPGSECPLEDGLDVLVNNAGAGVTARLAGTSLAGYGQVMNVNVRGCLLYAQHSYPHLARRSGA
jgi:NAD(P)-dependent dehydrogenase (short-subunit alcohol dehydrogenase family)